MAGRQIGNYRIIEYVGSGGFGSVFKAEDVTSPGRIVALKELHKKHTRNSSVKQRFFQEAIAMARLDHTNLPRLHTFGEDNGSYYLVMEFLSGKLLGDELEESGALQPDRAVSIISQILEAIGYAHRNGIIHRDLKPENIMLVGDDEAPKVKVLDFGIARMIGGENLTLTGEGFGTPAYMSPERIAGTSALDHRADIYSAGIILYEMLSGQAPFTSTATDPAVYWTQMRDMHLSEPLPPITSSLVPAELDLIVRKATAKRVEHRYATADDMLIDLKEKFGSDASIAAAKQAQLLLIIAPAAAEVFLDDLPRGSSDEASGRLLIKGLAPGLRNVRVASPGYNDYRINVSLEQGRQTVLQVALAARATVAMPPAERTAPVDFKTAKMQGGDEAETALIVVESLPVGSKVFVGSSPIAEANEDGRATIRLNPGVHEIQVTAPSGATSKKLVKVSSQDTDSLKTMELPLAQNTASAPATLVGKKSPPRSGNTVAAVATVLLLLALGLAAYFVLRGASRESAPIVSTAAQSSLPPAAQETPPVTRVESNAVAQIEPKESRPEKPATEKPSPEKKPAESVIVQSAPPPDSPAPPDKTAQPVAGSACVAVIVASPAGLPVSRLRVALIEQPGSGAEKLYGGRLNPNGRWHYCGLTPGSKIRVEVLGPNRFALASRQVVVAPGKNFVQITLDAAPATAPQLRPRKMPFSRRP